jgi:CRP-like cAMP-binding protein
MKASLAALFRELARPVEREFPAGAGIFRDGDPACYVYAVARGVVRVVRFTPEGTQLTLFRAEVGQTFAEAALFAENYHCTALAETTCLISCHDCATLLAALKSHPEAMLRYSALLSQQVRDLRTQLETLTIRSADDRILHYLQLIADRNGVAVQTTTRKEIAQELGLTHETFYRRLAALEKKGMLRRDREQIVLLPPRQEPDYR